MQGAVLAVDTSTETLAVGLRDGAGRCATTNGAGGALASAQLLPQVQRLLREAGLALADLQALAFGRGPGAFTGLRTACSVAQGLALGAGLPVIAIDSLQIVAEDAWAQTGRAKGAELWVAMDARMGQCYAARYRAPAADGAAWQVVCEPALVDPEDMASYWGPTRADTAVVCCGSGLALAAAALPAQALRIGTEADRAAALLALACAGLARGEGVDAAQALPLYLRDKVALTTAERARRAEQVDPARAAAVAGAR